MPVGTYRRQPPNASRIATITAPIHSQVLIRCWFGFAPAQTYEPFAIDLPLEDSGLARREGKVRVSYNSLAYLQERHDVPQELLRNIAAVETLAPTAAESLPSRLVIDSHRSR